MILSTNWLQLLFDCKIKLFLISLHFGDHEVLVPSLKDISHLFNSVCPCFVLKHSFWILLKLPIVLQWFEAVHLHDFHSSHGLPFTWPERHDLGSEGVLFAELRFLSELLLKLLYLTLLRIEQGVAPSALCIDWLLFLVAQPALGLDEFLHGFCAEAQNQLVKTLSEVFAIENLLHFLGCCKCRQSFWLSIWRHWYLRCINFRTPAASILVEVKWSWRSIYLNLLIVVFDLIILDNVFEHGIPIWRCWLGIALASSGCAIGCRNLRGRIIDEGSLRSYMGCLLCAHGRAMPVSIQESFKRCHFWHLLIAFLSLSHVLLPCCLIRLNIFDVLIFYGAFQMRWFRGHALFRALCRASWTFRCNCRGRSAIAWRFDIV